MLSALKRKLNSRSGVSMTLALIFFLLCVAVSGIVMTAASASAGSIIGNRQSQRGYLAVASAARLVMSDLDGLSYRESRTDGGLPPQDDGFSGSELIGDGGSPASRFDWTVNNGSASVALKGDAAALSYTLDFPAIEDEGIPAVKGEIVIGRDLTLTVRLTDGDSFGDGRNEMAISYAPVITQPVTKTSNSYGAAGETTSYIYTAAVSWEKPVVTGSGATV